MAVILAGCGGDVPSPVGVNPPTATASAPSPVAERSPVASPTARPTPAPPTPTPVPTPRLLAEADPAMPLRVFGPGARGTNWLVTRSLTEPARFAVINARPRGVGNQSGAQRTAIPLNQFAPPFLDGRPLGWTSDGALLFFSQPLSGTVDTLWALEPTIGGVTSVLTTSLGSITGVAWLNSAMVYATESDVLNLTGYAGEGRVRRYARMADRRLLPDGLTSSPDRRFASLLVASAISPTLELYLIDPAAAPRLIDSVETGDPAAARVVWSSQGRLAYSFGQQVRIYDLAANTISETGIEGTPLDWQAAGVLIRRAEDGGLVRWSPQAIQPFDSGSGPLVVEDARTLPSGQVALLIGGQIWVVSLP